MQWCATASVLSFTIVITVTIERGRRCDATGRLFATILRDFLGTERKEVLPFGRKRECSLFSLFSRLQNSDVGIVRRVLCVMYVGILGLSYLR